MFLKTKTKNKTKLTAPLDCKNTIKTKQTNEKKKPSVVFFLVNLQSRIFLVTIYPLYDILGKTTVTQKKKIKYEKEWLHDRINKTGSLKGPSDH